MRKQILQRGPATMRLVAEAEVSVGVGWRGCAHPSAHHAGGLPVSKDDFHGERPVLEPLLVATVGAALVVVAPNVKLAIGVPNQVHSPAYMTRNVNSLLEQLLGVREEPLYVKPSQVVHGLIFVGRRRK